MTKETIWLNSGNGQKLFPFAFTFDQFSLEQFALSMSKKTRFCGLTRRDISTAEHSLILSYIVPNELAPYAHIHDLGEVPFGDIPGPVKAAPEFQGIREAEDAVTKTITLGLGLEWPFPEIISKLDKLAVQIEAPLAFDRLHADWQFRSTTGYEQEMAEYQERLSFLPPEVAFAKYVMRFYELFPNYSDYED